MAFNPKSAYAEKLRDPRWQRKRLEVMNRDDFTCQFCEDKESTLNVHHIEYIKGREPWEYDLVYLITLCESCHAFESQTRKQENESLIGAFGLAGTSSTDINDIACTIAEFVALGERVLVKQLISHFSVHLWEELKLARASRIAPKNKKSRK